MYLSENTAAQDGWNDAGALGPDQRGDVEMEAPEELDPRAEAVEHQEVPASPPPRRRPGKLQEGQDRAHGSAPEVREGQSQTIGEGIAVGTNPSTGEPFLCGCGPEAASGKSA